MRMLWISLLLIGSVSCDPPKPGSGGEQPMWWYAASPSQEEPSKPVYQNPSGQVGGHRGVHYYSGGAGGADIGSSHGAQQGAPSEGGPYQFAQESWSSSSDPSGVDEPVFTPVDEEDQVYAYKSKSRYNRKQLRFSQFRYTPTEPVAFQPPVFPHPGKNPQHPGHKGY